MSVRGCVCPLRVCLSVVVKNFTVNTYSVDQEGIMLQFLALTAIALSPHAHGPHTQPVAAPIIEAPNIVTPLLPHGYKRAQEKSKVSLPDTTPPSSTLASSQLMNPQTATRTFYSPPHRASARTLL